MDNDLHNELMAGELRLAESQAKLSYNRGKLDQAREDLMRDSELRELLRAKAWRRTGAELELVDGRPAGMPEGWPGSIDGDEYVRAYVESKAAPRKEEPESTVSTPLISKFRSLLN